MGLFNHKHDNVNTDPNYVGDQQGVGMGQNTGLGNQTGMASTDPNYSTNTGHHLGGHNTTNAGPLDGGMTGTGTGTGIGSSHHHNTANAAPGPMAGGMGGTGIGTGAAGAGGGGGMHLGHHDHNPNTTNVGTGHVPGSGGLHQNPIYPSPNAPMSDGAAMAAGPHGGVTSSTDKHGNPIHPGQPGTTGKPSALAGKIEHAIGTLVGSENLKAKGLAKEQQAAAYKAQGAELNAAERLEAEALARRERAVAHGAHPDHGHLGGHNPGAGAPTVNEMGGANFGVTGAGGVGSTARGGY